tara:strand:+ start:1318 stop:2109 length:792 start_codon:yes stop_codon:yes gene_type:complete
MIGFGYCLNESSLSGESIKVTSNSDWVELQPNGILSDGGSWWISNEKLYVDVSWSSTYIYPLSEGLVNGRLKGYWIGDGKSESTKKELSKPADISQSFRELFTYVSLVTCINNYINDKISTWKKKGEFEKTVDYQKRVHLSRIKKMKVKYRKEAVNYYKKEALNSIEYKDISLKEYNADLEVFLINISGYGNFILPVPIAKAPSFKKKFAGGGRSILPQIILSNLDFILEDDKFIVSYFEVDGYIYNHSANIRKYDEKEGSIK